MDPPSPGPYYEPHEVRRLWPYARCTVWGLILTLESSGAPLLASELRMAVRLADAEFNRLEKAGPVGADRPAGGPGGRG